MNNVSAELINAISIADEQTLAEFSHAVWARLVEIISAPVQTPQMLWILLPSITALLIMGVYFGMFKKEKLGWNTAVGNTLVFIFVSLDLLKFLERTHGLWTDPIKTSLAFSVAILGVLLLIINFFHLIPENLSFGISSALPVHFIAIFSIILIYSDIKIADYSTLIAVFLMVFVFGAVLKALQSLEPDMDRNEESEND